MSSQLKNAYNHVNEDLVIWAAAQVEAMKQPGRGIPSWMAGVFQEAMEREKEIKAAASSVKEEDGVNKVDVQDDIFNFEMVYFKVENTIFTVIKDWVMVEDSPFQAMFTLPASGTLSAAVEGTTVTNPIILEQTSAASFKAFLCLLYGSRGKPLQTYDEWVGALELAMRWNFDQVRKQAVTGLHSLLPSLSPAARIQLGRRFSVGAWLRTGLIDLVTEVAEGRLTRTALIDGTEFPLDMATIANIFFACFQVSMDSLRRESARASAVCTCNYAAVGVQGVGLMRGELIQECKSCATARENSAKAKEDIVDGIFGLEVKGCLYSEGL